MRALLILAALSAALPARAQEWYIPKRQSLIKGGSVEAGLRAQLSANNDGLLDTLRLDGVPSLRYAPLRRLELYAELPMAYGEREDVSNFTLLKTRATGFGDTFGQLAFEGFSGEDWKILFNLDGSFPTGKSPYRHRVSLGSGHFAAAFGQTMMKVIDPVVLFTHLGYQKTFARRPAGAEIAPGRDIRFRFGGGLSLNPRVQTSMHVTGDLVGSTRVNKAPVAGSSGTLLRLGWGLDWILGPRTRVGFDAALGMTKNTPDATIAFGVTTRLR